ncbi:hypothetical protein Tco_0817445 [Tanacetum coccineum]|uniref:Uncharacterized protein n=1 Tax=Tanacetum coccineum TaxID=301880 RepID=A0ABQ5CNR5_9ASTR
MHPEEFEHSHPDRGYVFSLCIGDGGTFLLLDDMLQVVVMIIELNRRAFIDVLVEARGFSNCSERLLRLTVVEVQVRLRSDCKDSKLSSVLFGTDVICMRFGTAFLVGASQKYSYILLCLSLPTSRSHWRSICSMGIMDRIIYFEPIRSKSEFQIDSTRRCSINMTSVEEVLYSKQNGEDDNISFSEME